jgi:flavin-dependent dehydrogenase
MMMTYDYDVIVVGARVAGSATGMLLARRGHRVLLLDRAKMPSDTVSTHAILRSGVLQLQRWGVLERVFDEGTPEVRDVTLGFGDERIEIELSTDHGVEALCAPRRFILDEILVDAAVESGAEFRAGFRVTDLVRDADRRVHGVVAGPDEETITARFVIGADGVNSRIAGLVGAREYASHEPTNAVHYAYFTGVEHRGFWFQFTPGTNTGLIETNDNQVLVFAGRPSERMSAFREDPETEFFRLLREGGSDLAELVEAGERVSPFRGTPGLRGFIRKPWGPGLALVGDAGYTKDPISAHGISDALRDAELCARAIDEALRDPVEEAGAIRQYEQRRDSLSWEMYRESAALAAYGWDAAEASTRMRSISSAVHRECEALLALSPWRTPAPVA